jgi:hypothetical protein
MHDALGPFLGTEQGVEGGDTVDLCRRDRKAGGYVAKAAFADPTRGVPQRVQCRQQEMATFPLSMPSDGQSTRSVVEYSAIPGAGSGSEDPVYSRSFRIGWR